MTEARAEMGHSSVDLGAELDDAGAAAVERFGARLRGVTSAAVAFSGGVDSSLTAALAARVLGADAVACVLGVSPSLAASERRDARTTAEAIGLPLIEVETEELTDPQYVANRGDRCYFCKRELFSQAIVEAVDALGFAVLLCGDTADDRARADRPGHVAAAELGVWSPLADAGIGKDQVRSLARQLGLPVWDKPATPCLASRVEVGTAVTVEVLSRVERAEAELRRLGLRELRVRHTPHGARVELGEHELRLVRGRGLVPEVLRIVRDNGYPAAELVEQPLVRS